MKKILFSIKIVYIFLLVSGSVYANNESVFSLGGDFSWSFAETRRGITEARSIRPQPVLLLSSAPVTSISGYSAAAGVSGNFAALTESSLDLAISFDEGRSSFYRDSIGNYRVTVPPGIETVDRAYARTGTGAALFGTGGAAGTTAITIEPLSRNALFSQNNRIRDFTIEFWLYPLNLDNGEKIISWSSLKNVNGNFITQHIQCSASRNKLQWSFVNFFTLTNGNDHINIEFSGNIPVIPRTWSHHLIRFDANTGMLEYIVDGVCEAVAYTTPSGRESSSVNGEVYTPVTGASGVFLLGENYTGILDEFKIHNVCAGRSSVQKYPASGGRVETRAIDLGDNSSTVVRIDVTGGRTSINGNSASNEYRQNGRFRFSDDSEMNFFIRSSDNLYLLNSAQWVSFTPGAAVNIRGRYIQIAADFYPSADGETTPYLEQVHIVYIPGEPPLPPRNVTAIAADGAVELRWRHSPNENTTGYLVYYSSVRGELFGTDASLGASPINVGMVNSVYIDGLLNGTLYYFRIAAYDIVTGTEVFNIGEFSAEVTARPLLGLRLLDMYR